MEYFTPKLEDLHVGYECEKIVMDYSTHFDIFLKNGASQEDYEKAWDEHYNKTKSEKCVLTAADFQLFLQFTGNLRTSPGLPLRGYIKTPYLTKEQIEAEGWRGFGKARTDDGRVGYEKGNYFLIYHEDKSTKMKGRIEIIIKDVLHDPYTEFTSNGRLFLGQCKDINTFRYICKLLGI